MENPRRRWQRWGGGEGDPAALTLTPTPNPNPKVKEIQQLFETMGQPVTLDEAKHIFGAANRDEDGEIDYEEFKIAYHSDIWRKLRALGQDT